MSAIIYWVVVQAVTIFGAETRALLEAMSRNPEGVHMGFLRQITGKKENRQWDGT